MRVPGNVRRALRLPPTRERIARELDDEVRFHVEMRARRLEADGLPPDEAYAEALRRFGDVDDLRDYSLSLEVTQMRRMNFRDRLHGIERDLRFAARQFKKSPGFIAVATLTLALGIGATTAIFTVVNGVVLQPLPFPRGERIVQLSGTDAKGQSLRFGDPTFDELANGNRSLSALAEYNQSGLPVSSNGAAERVTAAAVSNQFFDVLGVKPALGRLFDPSELHPGSFAVVISHGLWERAFGGSPSAIGGRLMSLGTPLTVIGVLPAGQEFPANVDVWYPRETFAKNTSYTAHNWRVVGRLRDGVSVEQAQSDVNAVLRRLHDRVGDETITVGGTATPLRDQIVGDIRPLLWLILAASAVLLLIAVANVANLLIARMAVRDREIAVRLALGADRLRLAQQLLIEASLLSLVGCAGGLVLAELGLKVLIALQPTLIPRLGEIRLDGRVLLFGIAVSAATAIGLGLIAAWRGARGDLRDALAHSQRTQGGGGASYRVRGSLVVVQLAMTVVLLVGAALLGRSFVRLMTIDPGFRTKNVVVAGLSYDPGNVPNRLASRMQYLDEVAARAAAIPGVTEVGISDAEPFAAGSSNGTFLVLPGTDVTLEMNDLQTLFRDKTHTGFASYSVASAGYFAAMHIPLIDGRMFDDRDRAGAPHVALINAALAAKQWPGESAIGKVVEFGNIDGDLTPITVVGVVGDTREQDLTSTAAPMIYVSYRQRRGNSDAFYVTMATNGESATIAAARRAIRDLRPDVPMRFTTIEDIIARSIASQRFMLFLVGVFAAVALLLATLGVYSVVSYLVAQRDREISIRVALGAQRGDIVRLVLRQGLALALIGAAVGGAAAFGTTRVLQGLLYQITATDPLAFGAVLVLLALIALVASYVPARRAAGAAPMEMLRRD
jgi:predicted permease